MSKPKPPVGEARPDQNDTKNELAVLKASVEILEKTQRESNQTVRTACMMVLGIAIVLIGWNIARGIWADSEKAALRHDLKQFIQSEIIGTRTALESNIVARLGNAETNLLRTVFEYTNFLQSLSSQVSTVNNNVLYMGAMDRLRQGDGFLYASNYLDATVCYVLASSWFLKVGREQLVHKSIEQVTKECLPQLAYEHLEMPSRAFLGISVIGHLNNLLGELDKADENTRYTLEIAEMRNAIRQAQQRK